MGQILFRPAYCNALVVITKRRWEAIQGLVGAAEAATGQTGSVGVGIPGTLIASHGES
ncbi:Uncharacterised protein [Providencia rustigianii]|nr:Uncharacterised protein [Providencia rustigianii]